MNPTAIEIFQAGFDLYEQNEIEAAVAKFEELVRLLPQDAWAHIYLANALNRVSPEAAEAEYKIAISLEPDDPDVLWLAGDFYVLNNKIEQSVALYEASLLVGPDADRHYVLGGIEEQVNDFASAIQHYKHSLHLCPTSWMAAWSLARAMALIGETDRAKIVLHQFLHDNPDSKSKLIEDTLRSLSERPPQ